MEMNYKYVKNGLFWCILAFYAPNHRNADKTHSSCKELKYVKNGLFCCIPAFYAPKLRNAGKTLYLLKRLVHVFLRCFMKKKLLRLKILSIQFKSFYIVLLLNDKTYENKRI
ncbi:hypothetical protein E2C01_038548 [Portunus trituberculatus]|uniref:Uncharacterized protein n=1 Tax=Portunus trituberculatus TaxID=210409 RepID=A0A5B7FHH3_PORTR|nr:hypothetical protein [Portunus trituberculatus]